MSSKQSVVMLNVVMSSVVILSVDILSVDILSVVAPPKGLHLIANIRLGWKWLPV
jgi:hypothetical protein